MILYRIVKSIYAEDLSGTGARLYGGRWNSEGKATLYLASSKSLAALELLVHLPPLTISENYVCIAISVPDDSIEQINLNDLPKNWNDIIPPPGIKKFGDAFLSKKDFLLLKVPSAVIPTEYNYLLNLQNAEMEQVKIIAKEPFSFDRRLYKN